MRKKDINGIMHDLLYLENWRHPVSVKAVPYKAEINLLTGKLNVSEEDSVTDLLKKKRNWFKERIKNLKGKFSDLEKAKIVVFGV